MSKVLFVGLDVHAETIAVAVAESEGEVRSLGVIPNRLDPVRPCCPKTLLKAHPREHSTYSWTKTKAPASLLRRKAGLIQTKSVRRSQDLTGSLHIRTCT